MRDMSLRRVYPRRSSDPLRWYYDDAESYLEDERLALPLPKRVCDPNYDKYESARTKARIH